MISIYHFCFLAFMQFSNTTLRPPWIVLLFHRYGRDELLVRRSIGGVFLLQFCDVVKLTVIDTKRFN
jgi:hypothetical protein